MQRRHLDPNVIQLCIIVWMDVNCPIYEYFIKIILLVLNYSIIAGLYSVLFPTTFYIYLYLLEKMCLLDTTLIFIIYTCQRKSYYNYGTL